MEREETQSTKRSDFDFTSAFNLLELPLLDQEYYLMELGMSAQKEWRYSMAVPTDNQLSWLGSLKFGWSTVSAKYSQKQTRAVQTHTLPTKSMSRYEVNQILKTVSEIERGQKLDELKILLHFKKYKELLSIACGNGTTTCILCGVAIAKQRQYLKGKNHGTCHDCGCQMCSKCTRVYTLKDHKVKLCVLCNSKRELWKMSGAWYSGDHDAFKMSIEEISLRIHELQEELSGTIENTSSEDIKELNEKPIRNPLVTQYSIDDMALPYISGYTSSDEGKDINHHLGVSRQLSLSMPMMSVPDINVENNIDLEEEAEGDSLEAHNKERRRSSQLMKAHTIACETISQKMSQAEIHPRRSLNQPIDVLLRRLSNASGDVSVRDILFEHSLENKLPRSVKRLVEYSSPRSSWGGSSYTKDSEESESTGDDYTDDSLAKRNRLSLQEESMSASVKLGLPKHNSLNRLRKRAEDIFRTMSFSPVPSREATPEMKSLIEFSMTYDRDAQELRVTILRCKDLKAADSNGLSDPYVNVFLAGGDPSTKQTTSIKQATLNPEYGEEIVYQGISESFVRRHEIMFVVYDYDMVSRDDFLGAASIPIRRVKHNVEKFCLHLTDNCPEILKTPKEDYGQALVSVHYDKSHHTLNIEIVKCVRLRPANRKKLSANPSAKIILHNKGHPESTKKTRVNYLTLNPEFNEELAFSLDGKDVNEINLRLAIMHRSRSKRRYTQIGEATLDPLLFKSIQTRAPVQEWVQLLRATCDK